MSKVLFVIPTTARRLKLLSNVVQEVLDKNKNHECEFIVVKNGNFPEDVYDEFELQPEVIKERSEPAANIAVAINKGLSYQRDDHDWVVILEDDFLIHKENWIDTYIKVMESKDKCGCIGSRVHGKQSKMRVPSLQFESPQSFEVFWTDGVNFLRPEITWDHKLDEQFWGNSEVPDYCVTLIDHGWENWYVYVDHTHDTISEEKKYEYSETHINQFANRGKLWTKWCETDNDKIFTYVMMDLVEDRQYAE